MKPLKILTFISLATLTSFQASAEPRVFGFMNADFGGDTLVDVTYTNGSTADIDAGRGVTFGGGLEISVSDSLAVQASFAWKYTTVPQATNGDLSFTRFPAEAVVVYKLDHQIRMGAGLSYHLNNSLDGSGFASAADQDFDNAFGTIFSFEYMINPVMSWGMRYNSIEYTPSDGGPSADGSSVGFNISFYGR